MPKYLHDSLIKKSIHLHQTTFEILKYLQQNTFWNCLFWWKCKNKITQKVAKNIAIYLGHFMFSKKRSQWVSKISPTGEKLPNLVSLKVTSPRDTMFTTLMETFVYLWNLPIKIILIIYKCLFSFLCSFSMPRALSSKL
jgi:hypothetical protein